MYLFIYWFISILLLLFLSGYIIVSCYYLVSSYIFHAWLHEVIPNSNLYWQPAKEVTDKTSPEAAYTMQLCIEGKFEQSLPQIKMLFSNHTFLL